VSHYGEVSENPVTGERAICLTDPFEHPDQVLVSHLFVSPGGRVATAHLHPNLRERFHVISGRVGFHIDGEKRQLGPGDAAEVPANTVHDWWQIGNEEASVVVEVEPGIRFVQLVGTFFGLARDGKSDAKGLPKPLQLAVSAAEFRDTIRITSPPPWLQRAIFGVLAPIGRARGLQPYYERYVNSDVVVEPDPAALALLGADGRLRRD
jgi:mannose-6-phosphate isomerase-like protein (cupin superfamily)